MPFISPTGQVAQPRAIVTTTTPPVSPGETTTLASAGELPGNTSWHVIVLWFLGAMALIALADPAPNIATLIVVLIILETLLKNWNTYASYLGI